MTHDHKALLKAAFAATACGDGSLFVSLLSDAVTWRIIGSTAWSRVYRGKAEVLELLKALVTQFEGGRNQIMADRLIAEGDLVVVEGHGLNRTRHGPEYSNTYCWIFRMSEGQAIEITEYADTELMTSALQAPPWAGGDIPGVAARV